MIPIHTIGKISPKGTRNYLVSSCNGFHELENSGMDILKQRDLKATCTKKGLKSDAMSSV